jgi:hypothetical protein
MAFLMCEGRGFDVVKPGMWTRTNIKKRSLVWQERFDLENLLLMSIPLVGKDSRFGSYRVLAQRRQAVGCY